MYTISSCDLRTAISRTIGYISTVAITYACLLFAQEVLYNHYD
jgi:hypothetical protein